MTIDHEEKRGFMRMAAHHDLHFRIRGQEEFLHGTCINLSASGILFSSAQALDVGSYLQVNMTPQYAVVAPFDAEVEVLRSTPRAEGDYEIAGRIVSIN